MTAVAVIGVGRIGLPLVGRLVGAGFRVVAHDVRGEVESDVAEARWAATAPAAVGGADVVITVLPGTPELQALMTGDGRLLAQWPAGAVWLDLTSTAPEVADELAVTCADRGIDYLAAPIGGGEAAMREGTATLFVGGAGGVLDRVRPVLRAFAADADVRLVGDQRAACAAKLLVNAVWFGQVVLYTEVLLAAQHAGIDGSLMREIIGGTAADSAFVNLHLPALLNGCYLPNFGLERCVEELDAVERFAAAAKSPHELLSDVARLHREALAEFGPVPGELLAAALLERRAGRKL